jgi:cytochrome b involved in lipid metabolism
MKMKIYIAGIALVIVAAFFVSRPSTKELSDTYSRAEETSTSTSQIAAEMKTYSLDDISTHADAQSCYTAINGSIYDLTQWIEAHPGGAEKILLLCGIDGTKEFNEQHGTSNEAIGRLASFKIGILE